MTLVCAHRGESWSHLENTAPALAAAINAGADVVELDVRVTSDGVPIVQHDATLARIWGDPAAVSSTPWEVVASLRSAGERIPTLQEALDLFAGRDTRVLIDVTSADIAQAAHRVVIDHPARVNAAWCGATAAMRAVRHLDPEAVVYLAAEDLDGSLADVVADLRPAYLNCDGSELLPDDLAAARDLGLSVSVWTIDDAPTMALLAGMGVDSITTNRVHLLQRVLAGVSDPHTNSPSAMESATGAGGIGSPFDGASLSIADLRRARDVAVDLAAWAVRRARRGPASIDTKRDAADLVTDADRDIETRVRAVLAEAFPQHAVVGEEQGGHPAGLTWYCDPVDGTTNYANSIPFSAFSLALCADDVPVVGVVADLAREQIIDAIAGGGLRVDGLPVRPRPAPLSGGVVLTELAGALPWPGMDDLRGRCAEQGATLRVMGSGALAITQVALGRAAGCVIDRYHHVDHAAAVCLAAEAGHRVIGATPDLDPTPGPGLLRVGEIP